MKEILRHIPKFGIAWAIWCILFKVCCRIHLCQLLLFCSKQKDKKVLQYLKPYVSCQIQRQEVQPAKQSEYVWTMWWQGETDMPEIIRASVNSQRKNIKGKHILITKDNFKQYITLKPWIISKLLEKKISITQLSDIVRANLLRQYGGLWLDATILVTDQLTIIDKKRYWTWKENMPNIDCISKGRWVGGCTYMPQNHIFANFLANCFDNYWKDNDALIDYFLIDYFTSEGLRLFPLFRAEWESLPERDNLYENTERVSKAYSEENYKQFMQLSPLHYLSWKKEYTKHLATGEKTLYTHIIDSYGN